MCVRTLPHKRRFSSSRYHSAFPPTREGSLHQDARTDAGRSLEVGMDVVIELILAVGLAVAFGLALDWRVES